MSYSIITDTSANLPSPLLKADDVLVLPFHYSYDGKEHACLDTEAIDGKLYYDAMRGGAGVTTSQINPQAYIDCFEPLLHSGQDILFIGMSSGISGSFQSAMTAMAQLKEDYPDREFRMVDTLGASLGEGILVLKAVEMRKAGMSLSDVARELLALRHRMCQIFMVDDLMFLKKTGRVSGAVALVGTMLQIKPLLKGNERGQIVTYAKARGRRKAIEALARRYDEQVVDAGSQIVGIAHADCEADAQFLAGLLRRNHPPRQIMTVMYEPVTGAHVGPGTLALFFLADETTRFK
ncbi:MAG: DegV family protein [Clostridia bacterium]|nr:DegV family protein [Clostridia bacterium]